jgi:hypothetical protein
MTDHEFVQAFEACTLPSEAFDHRNHVRLAWLYLREQPLLAALPRFVDSLRRYAGSLGASAKYHETITYAFMFLIHERMTRRQAESFEEFAVGNADLFGPILKRYYRPETLASDLARSTFVMPDAERRRPRRLARRRPAAVP